MTWTFDPLVRRNAWFNIDVLGAQVHEYLVDFYGPIDDAINAGDESDRLLVAWPTSTTATPAPTAGRRRPGADRRARRPTTSSCCGAPTGPRPTAWRHRVRDELGGRLAAGGRVVGFTRDGEYLVVEAS